MTYSKLSPAHSGRSATLTLSRRFELCFGRRLGSDLDERIALEQYGPVAAAVHGSGVNPIVRIEVSGDIDPLTGMVANLGEIKSRFNELLTTRYDHKMLNVDTPPFESEPPTIERIAQQLFADATHLSVNQPYLMAAVEYQESETSSARVSAHGLKRVEWFSLSAARETMSPQLSPVENEKLFGAATRLHGHGYRVGLVLSGEINERYGTIASHASIRRVIGDIEDEFDHRSLNELRAFRGRPTTSESFSRVLFELAAASLPVTEVILWENDWLAASTDRAGTTLRVRDSFQALHRLHRPQLSAAENHQLYGKCNHPSGHGHDYHVQLKVRAPYDERSGTIARLDDLRADINRVLARYRHRHLDLECEEFAERPSSGEVIAQVLWERFEESLGDSLEQLTLDETPNNRFIITRQPR